MSSATIERWPRTIPYAVAALWSLLVVASVGMQRIAGVEIPTCLFRRVTGVPCPTCGGTRCAASLADGSIADAISFNPLVAALLIGLPAWLALRRARPGTMIAGHTHTAAWITAGLAILLTNWAYLLVRGV